MQRGKTACVNITNPHEIYNLGADGGKDKLIRVCRQKVNSKGHDETK